MSRLKKNANKKPEAQEEKKPDLLVEKFPVDLGVFETFARQLQKEAAKVWNTVCTLHRTLYIGSRAWLSETGMDDFVKGRFNLLHSQSVQAIVSTYYEAWERTRELREKDHTDWRYPYRKKYFFTVTWKKSAITHNGTYLKLSNKRGVKSLELTLPEHLKDAVIHQVQLVWHRNGYWLHVTVEKPALSKVQGNVFAAADPGEVHALALTDGEDALVISGRLLRSLARLRNKELRKFQRAISRTKKGSRRRKKLMAAKYEFLNWIERQMEHVLHAISAIVVSWCKERNVKKLFYGDPSGVRDRDCGRKHNQRMSQWPFGWLRKLVEYKLKRHGIELEKKEEHGTTGTCPECAEYTKQTGRVYKCGNKECGFAGAHRDVVGASGILDVNLNGRFTKGRKLPEKVVYVRPVLRKVKQCKKKHKTAA
ncbi:MAG: transposase [Peptococcaceae bacterium]|nr:transposase [Peptococcaceae bacterium]